MTREISQTAKASPRRICGARARGAIFCIALSLFFATVWLRADQVEMRNGDRFSGKVLSVTSDTLILQSDLLGRMSLPRAKVAVIALGANASTNIARLAPPTNNQSGAVSAALTNANADLSAAFRELGANTNFIRQIREQFLSAAGPDANKKYDELVSGLMSGNVNMDGLRAEAKSSVDQLRAMKRELGSDADGSLDVYLDILEGFLKETAPAAVSVTNAVIPRPKPGPAPVPGQN
jgi:hypothetical protein